MWAPTVDDDMVELFFAEVNERLEGLAVKLVECESRPEDAELLRDVFRDLHTIKGSSAMVGLKPMNDVAHAAEDLMGQVRDGQRRLDRPIIDALLAALDELRGIATRALRREALSVRADLVRRLRDPASAPAAAETIATAAEPAAGAAPASAQQQAKQTIRVDFDKLDHLLNLVGELVLGRDSLRGSITSLSSLGAELSSDRQLARRIEVLSDVRQQRSVVGAPRRGAARQNAAGAIGELREELGRVERVLSDIAHELDHSSGRLDAVSGELRQAVMRLRMVPVGGVLRKHHRTVRDLANKLGKKARVILSGEDTELDKLL
ncbi:MAG TPA: Hpt domain-containing protein, partial [Planctomycetota bacterium]|nr:Hpt domain-containing protein [Planctomycetota bacterium]